MDWKEFILALLTLIFGTGWLWTWKSYRRKNEGEATQSEAEGWAKQQMVYQKTIADMENSCEYIRQDRNLLREENTQLREENAALREKINKLEDKMFEMQREISRLGRRIEAMNEKNTKKSSSKNESHDNK